LTNDPSSEALRVSDETAAAPAAEPPKAAHSEHAIMKLFARGSAWAVVNFAGTYVLRLGSNLLMWRLLYPDAFGLMAIVNAVIMGLSMFSDIGVAQSVVQNERGEETDFLNTVWTLQVIRGLGVCAAACLAAWPVARFYHQPELTGLLLVVASSVGVSAFNSTNFFTASRRVAIKRLTLIDIGSQFVNLGVMVAWSAITHSVWALAAASVVNAVFRLFLGHVALPGIRNRFHWDREVVRSVSHFGRWIFFSTVITFLVSYSDKLILGRLISMDRLGVYGIAIVWSTFPSYVVSHLTSTVLFPVLSRVNSQRGSFEKVFHRTRVPLLFAAAWLFSCLPAGGPALVRFLYDQRALEAGVLMPLLGVGYWVSTLESTNGQVLLALGQPKWVAVGQIVKLGAMIVLLPIGNYLFGFYGTVAALSLTEVPRYIVSAQACRRAGLNPLGLDLLFSLAIPVAGAIGWFVRAGYQRLQLHPANGRVDAFLEGLLILLVLSGIWLLSFRVVRRRMGAPEAPPEVAPLAS
jgi:O-antigen/teichoic acid export membrane protein